VEKENGSWKTKRMTTNHLKALAKNRAYHLDCAAKMDQKIKANCHHPPTSIVQVTSDCYAYGTKRCSLCNTIIDEATDGNP
jgi:hypothetical protein